MDRIIETLEDINKSYHSQKYILVMKLVNSGYCNMLVESLKTTHDNHSKNIIIKLMTELATFDIGQKEFGKSGLYVFICDILKTEIVEEYILDIALLIGNLGLKDSDRPTLFNKGIASIMINVLTNLTHINSKVKIMKVINMLCQTKLDTNEFIQLGILNHLLEALSKVKFQPISQSK